MRPTPRSLILDLLSTLRAGSMPVRALIAAGALFAIDGNRVRVALARLVASGRVESDERGRYRLGAAAGAVSQQVVSWRHVEDRQRPWSGGWIAVATGALGRADRTQLRRRERALRFLGFRMLAPGVELRPDNLAGGVPQARERLYALGLENDGPVFTIADLDEPTEQRARLLWDAGAIRRRYRELGSAIEASARRLPALPAEQAMKESFVLGGRVIHELVLDPLLPEPIVPAVERRELVESMRRYDRLGRAAWASFLRAFGVPTRSVERDLFKAGEPILLAAGGAT